MFVTQALCALLPCGKRAAAEAAQRAAAAGRDAATDELLATYDFIGDDDIPTSRADERAVRHLENIYQSREQICGGEGGKRSHVTATIPNREFRCNRP